MLETRKRLREIIETKTRQIHARDNKISELEKLLNEYKEESKELYEQGKDLRNENEELKLFKDKVIKIMKSKDTIVNKNDKMNELVDDVESYN